MLSRNATVMTLLVSCRLGNTVVSSISYTSGAPLRSPDTCLTKLLAHRYYIIC